MATFWERAAHSVNHMLYCSLPICNIYRIFKCFVEYGFISSSEVENIYIS